MNDLKDVTNDALRENKSNNATMTLFITIPS